MDERDSHVAAVKAELDLAVANLSNDLELHAAKRSSTIFRLEAGQLNSASNPKDTAELVEKLLLLNISDPGSENKSRSKALVHKAAGFVSSLMPLMSVALGMVGKVSEGVTLGLPVAVITNSACFLLDLASKEKERKGNFMSELDQISYHARRVRELLRHPEDTIIPLMQEKCLGLLCSIVNFLRGALKYLGQNIFTQIGKSLFSGAEVWQSCIKKLHMACEEYDQALLLQIASTVITQSQKEPSKSTDDAEFRKWLAPSSAENESRKTANLAQRADGTLQWVLELPELKEWRLSDASSCARTLWLTGFPGTGKSTISAYLVDLLTPQYPEDIVLNFFCKRGAVGLTECFSMVRTLCHQLTTKEAFYRKYLQEQPGLPRGSSREDLLFIFNTLIKEPLRAGPRQQTIFIILDGLDELEDVNVESTSTRATSFSGQTEIEIILSQIVALPRVKLLVTSRPLPQLHTILSASGVVRPITGADNATDIEKYVIHRVNSSTRLKPGFEKLKADPVDFFCSKANGVFLWVSVVLDVLSRAVSSRAFNQALEEIHPTMNTIYEDVFARAEQRGTLDLMREVLHWMVILPTPFTVRQMAIAAEISIGDKVLDMEGFLRTECGALVDLVPALGSGAPSDSTLELHLGHETFQAWLADKFGPRANLMAHTKATKTFLRYLAGPQEDKSLLQYAITRWQWHLVQSMGLGERYLGDFDEPSTTTEIPEPCQPEIALELFRDIFAFLSSPKAEQWLDAKLSRESFNQATFWEVHNTCVGVAAWCETNRDALSDDAIDQLELGVSEASQLKIFRDTVTIPGTIARMLWPRVCHAWIWNTSYPWQATRCGVTTLHQLDLYTNPEENFEILPGLESLPQDEPGPASGNNRGARFVASWRIRGKMNAQLAKLMGRIERHHPDHATLEAVMKAGGFDDLSGVCAANASIFLHAIEGKRADLQGALDAIQEAIDEDDGSAAYYFHLGKIYNSLKYRGNDSDESQEQRDKFAALALDAFRAAVVRDPDRRTEARFELYQAEEALLRKAINGAPIDLNRIVDLLEKAIEDDPRSHWYHHLFDVHKERGDTNSARDAYKRLLTFDPTWNTIWEKIADTWIDEKEFGEKRTFAWREWCDALIEAANGDPSYAHTYWNKWADKAKELADYNTFGISVEILEYGIEMTSFRTDTKAQKAYALFSYRLGEISIMRGDWEGAVLPLQEALARSADLDIWARRGALKYLTWVSMARKRWDEARAITEQRLAMPPDEIMEDRSIFAAYELRGEIALLEGKPKDSIREYKTALRLLEKDLLTDGTGDPATLRNSNMGLLYTDLGIVYEHLRRADQALAMFNRALPHIEHTVGEEVQLREQHESLWRKEGRWHMRLGWVREKLDSSDPKVLECYKQAVWVFGKTVYVEDDFVEITEARDAEAAVERVRASGKPSYLEGDAFLKERMREKITSIRTDWGNNHYQDEVQKPRQRGH